MDILLSEQVADPENVRENFKKISKAFKNSGGSLPSGGTEGQMIKKLSDTDYDVDWEDAPLLAWGFGGDINDQTDLISGGKILASLLPAIAITDTYVVSSQAAMLALGVVTVDNPIAAETGDICVRTDETKTYILKGTDPSVLADWELLLTPTGGVVSVFGRSGAVTAQSGDYSFSLISGTAGPTQGGTGRTTYAKGDVLIATAANTVGVVAASATDGYVFTWDAASGLPIWTAASGGGGSSLWTASGSDIYYSAGNVGINTSSPQARLTIASDDSGNTIDEASGILLVNNADASSSTVGQNPPYIYFDGNRWNGSVSVNSKIRIGMIADIGSPYLSIDAIRPTGAIDNLMTMHASSSPTGGIVSGSGASFAGTKISNNQIQTGTGNFYLRSNGNISNIDSFVYNSGNASHTYNTGTNTCALHDFKGVNAPGSGAVNQIFARFQPTISFGPGSTGSYTGLEINVTETSIPSSQNFLFRAGIGGGTFTSKFDITNTGQIFIANSAAPATPTNGGMLYIESGTLKYIGSSGTITILGAA